MNTQIQTVNFNGQTLSAFQQNGKFYVAMKPICENIGLDWAAQLQKIKRNYVLNKGMVMITTPSNGGNQEMICLPLGYLNGWLMNVDVNRVKPEIRETLIRYQMECYDVLFKHFIPQNSASPKQIPNKTTSLDREPLRNAVNLLVSKKGLNYSEAYTLVHQRFNVAHLGELDSEQIPQAVEYVHRVLCGEVLDKLPEKSSVLHLSEQDLRSLSCVIRFMPYLLAYYHLTEDAVRSLNHRLCGKVHDRFSDAYLHARHLARSLNIEQQDWCKAVQEIQLHANF